jgi:branched-subunit amino acid ABC-type transport system permease component
MGQVLVEGLIRGSELALLAVGVTLAFGISRFVNVAQVEFATLGAYGMLIVAGALTAGVVVQALLSIVAVGLLAVVLYRILFMRLLAGGAAMAMIGSLALSILIRAAIQTAAGPQPRQVDVPLERGVDIAGALITPSQIRMVIATFAVLAVLVALLRLTPLGRAIRAVSSNPELAAAAGIDVGRVTHVVWFLTGLLGALAGVLLAIDTQVSLGMGFALVLPVFAAAIMGGLGSVGGAIAAAYLLALAESALLHVDWGELVGRGSALMPVDYRSAVGFVLLIVVLVYRPEGLFGARARRV